MDRAMLKVGLIAPHFLLVWRNEFRGRVTARPDLTRTAAVDVVGNIYVNPEFFSTLTLGGVAFVVCHEIMHVAMGHASRRGERDPMQWNIAADMAINHALKTDGIEMPDVGLLPPPNYTGAIQAEPIWQHLYGNQPKAPQPKPQAGPGKPGGKAGQPGPPQGKPGQGQPGQSSGADPGNPGGAKQPGAGCGQIESPDEDGQQGSPAEQQEASEKSERVRAQMRAACRGIGQGSLACESLLDTPPAKVKWEQVLTRGADLAASRHAKDLETYARANRRSMPGGVIMPGWQGQDPSICVILDASGSVRREWLSLAVVECRKVQKLKRCKIYVIVHTHCVVWEGWIVPDSLGDAKMREAIAFTGGTAVGPAYAAMAKVRARFDAVIHFTDCEVCDWPAPETVKPRTWIIGALGGAQDRYPTPKRATVIPCE